MLEEIAGNEINANSDSRPLRPLRPLRIDTAQLPDRLCVKLRGELDEASAPFLRNRLACFLSEPFGDLVVDLSDLTFWIRPGSVSWSRFISASRETVSS